MYNFASHPDISLPESPSLFIGIAPETIYTDVSPSTSDTNLNNYSQPSYSHSTYNHDNNNHPPRSISYNNFVRSGSNFDLRSNNIPEEWRENRVCTNYPTKPVVIPLTIAAVLTTIWMMVTYIIHAAFSVLAGFSVFISLLTDIILFLACIIAWTIVFIIYYENYKIRERNRQSVFIL